jgi:DNA-binding MarR family transcriptional regulator
MVRISATDSAVWRVLACHLDSTEKRELLGYLAQAPDRLRSQGDLAAHVHADQITLLARLADLQEAGLVQRVRRPDGPYFRLSPAPRVRALLEYLPAYYAHSRR